MRLQAGTHEVEFTYRPARLVSGIASSLLAIALAAAVIAPWRRRGQAGDKGAFSTD